MKTREEIRMQFFTENNGAYWTNSQEEPDIDYVHWLEDKLINKLTIHNVVLRRELLLAAICEYNRFNTQKDIKAVDDWLEKWDSK